MQARVGERRVRGAISFRHAEKIGLFWAGAWRWRHHARSVVGRFITCRAIAWTIATVAIIAFAATFFLTRLEQPSPAIVESATVTAVGGVLVRPVGAATFFPAYNGLTLHAGDVVRTGPEGLCTLTYFEGSRLEIGPNATATVARLDLAAKP